MDRFALAAFVSGEAFFLRLVPLLFGASVYLASRFTATEATIAAIWPANGFLLAALLLATDMRTRGRTVLACFAANILANIAVGHVALACVSFAVVNMCEAVLAFVLLCALRAENVDAIGTWRLARFVTACALAPILPAMVGATVAAATLGAEFHLAVATWYMADVLGLLVVTPAFALAFRPDRALVGSLLKRSALFALLVAACALVFGQSAYPIMFLLMPVSMAIAFQLGQRYAAFATLLITTVSIFATTEGAGPTALVFNADQTTAVWLLQFFCLVNHFTVSFVAAAVADRDAMRDRIQALSEAEDQNRRHLDAALNSMSQGFCLFDRQRKLSAFNQRFLDTFGLDRRSIAVGSPVEKLLDLCTKSGVLALSEGKWALPFSDGDIDQTLGGGRTIRVSQRTLDGHGLVCTFTDVTAEREIERELRHACHHDALTGLANRRHFVEVMAQCCAKQAPFALMFIDVDHFKQVNDRLGHQAGDTLLQTIAARLNACVRDVDLVARFGGDEFAVLLTGANPICADMIARRMLAAVQAPIVIDGCEQSASLSIGIAEYHPGIAADALMARADLALYQVKLNGRNGFAQSGHLHDGLDRRPIFDAVEQRR